MDKPTQPGFSEVSTKLWYCAACETAAYEHHFRNGSGSYTCPICQSEDVFEDEIYEGSYCGRVLSNEMIQQGEDLKEVSCLQCPPHRNCILVKKIPRKGTS